MKYDPCKVDHAYHFFPTCLICFVITNLVDLIIARKSLYKKSCTHNLKLYIMTRKCLCTELITLASFLGPTRRSPWTCSKGESLGLGLLLLLGLYFQLNSWNQHVIDKPNTSQILTITCIFLLLFRSSIYFACICQSPF